MTKGKFHLEEALMIRLYKQADDKKEQIKILAQLNACSKDDIIDFLESQGVDVADDISKNTKRYSIYHRKKDEELRKNHIVKQKHYRSESLAKERKQCIMILYPECGYYNEERGDPAAPLNGECESCYRKDTCRSAFITTAGFDPFEVGDVIPLEKLPNYIGKKILVAPPNDFRYGRVATVEDVNVEKQILWLVNDFTCHEYGRVWVAYEYPYSSK